MSLADLQTPADDLFPAEADAPFRSQVLGYDHLADLARTVAAQWPAAVRPGAHALLRRLRDNEQVLHDARAEAARAADAHEPLTPDAEWLLDNFFVIEEVLREVRKDLPRGYYDELPLVTTGPWAGLPRIYALAVALITHTDSHLEDPAILKFAQAFQEVAPLTTGELWAVPTMLRLGLLENLRRLAAQMLAARAERLAALEWVERACETQHSPPLPSRPTDTFLVAWHKALRDRETDVPAGPLRDWLARHADDLSEVLVREHRRQAANQVSVGNCVTSLRLLNAIEWAVFFEKASLVEAVLRAEPTGVYVRQEFATRDRYRQAVERIAKASGCDEVEVARLAVARAAAGGTDREQHIGYYLVAEGKDVLARELGCRFKFRQSWRAYLLAHPYPFYFGALFLVTVLVAFGMVAPAVIMTWHGGWLIPSSAVLAALVVLIPASEVAVAIVNYLVCRLLPPRVLPKLDFTAGIPADCATVVVIPGMLFRADSASHLAERLELHHLANPDPHLRFVLLTDWADAPTEQMPEDEALVQAAVDAVRRLNERYVGDGPDRFFLFHRKRQYNPAEGRWMGWERKRGKLEEFNRLLRGATDTSYVVKTGDLAESHVRFVLTLDSDTVLPRDAARRLVATLAHPLNRPVLSADGRRVRAGYGVLQPRVSFLYRTGMRSWFARIFAGSAGLDPYSSASSDVYQDLFGAGTFTGKGLYEVDAFSATAGRAFPDNHILSHDLIESTFARCGLVTDIEVFDDFPAKYHAYARREHRWIRGDWQLLPWLGPRVPTPDGMKPNVIPALGRWKIFDNLRRSLSAPALVLLVALGCTVLPGPGWWWALVAVFVLAQPIFLQVTDNFLGLLGGAPAAAVLRQSRMAVSATVGQVALAAAFLANQAGIALDAIARTLWRLFVSRKNLLEWETAAAAEARLGTGLASFIVTMWPALVTAVGLGVVVGLVRPTAIAAVLPWLLAWFLSPLVAFLVSRPLPDRDPPLSPADRAVLRRTARKTWRFFETFVTAQDNWLPPDNYQEDPKGAVAHRTSPTNMGLLLLSNLSAHDLGYQTLPELADRLRKTFDTFDRLERYRGHFLNWYETLTLRPLPPAYVSTVDSGNLLGCLLALKNGLAEKLTEVSPSPTAVDGLLDTLNLAAEQLPKGSTEALRAHVERGPAARALAEPTPTTLVDWHRWLEKAEDLAAELPTGPENWSETVLNHVRGLRTELNEICPWARALTCPRLTSPSGNGGAGNGPSHSSPLPDRWQPLLAELNTPASPRQWADRLPALRAELEGWAKGTPAAGHEAEAEAIAAALTESVAPRLVAELNALAQKAVEFADGMDFRFLYSETRHLFAIGYNVPLERLDPAHYDLLASEAAITSFLAVARGVVPRKHWFQLGRLSTRVAGMPGLVSWGGTMFEYLMPRLLLPAPAGTLLDTAQHAAVARQMEYGRQTHTPWGVSESGFYVVDAESLDYQYQSFGVPGLGLKRGLGKELVVAPYATMLAVPINAHAAVGNFQTLRSVGGEGSFGFYEALDFTPDRLEPGEKCKVVKEYMAHHQGMGLCAITNRLMGDVHLRRLRAEPAVRAVELLLHERVPLDAPEVRSPEAETEGAGGPAPDAVNRRLTRPDTPAPRPHLLSNGHYTVMVTNAGSGWSACRGQAVTRWRSDGTCDAAGTFLYVRDMATGKAWSAGYQPLCVPADSYEVTYSADKAEFRRRDGLVETLLEVTVAPDRDAEVRRLTLVNHGTVHKTFEVTSYAEVVLNDPKADLAHPAFGKLFLETEWLPQWDALLCRRRPRSADQKPVFAVHGVSTDAPEVGPTEYETDRAKFLGRRRTSADPVALTQRLSGTVGAVLDPVFALRRSIGVAPGTTATLTFTLAVTDTLEAAHAVADHYRNPTAAARAFELAWAHSRVELIDLGLTPALSHLYQRLAGHVMFPPPQLRATPAIAANRQAQPGLWRHGISGDLPILVVCVSEGDGLPLARQALQAHAFWRGRGFNVDLVLLADRPASYREELYEALATLARASDSRNVIDRPGGGVFVRRAGQLGDDRGLLLAAARVVLYGDRGPLADQTESLVRTRDLPKPLVPTQPMAPTNAVPQPTGELWYANGTGGFAPEGREYVITGVPPAPWTNVLANPQAGCLTTDAGLGFTWAGNSQANRLTPWSNDPVSDPPAEAVYLRDEETGQFWSPTPLPAGGEAPTVVYHGAGYTAYVREQFGLLCELTAFVPVADPVKVLRLRITNRTDRRRRLTACFYAEWVLGTVREQTAWSVVTEVDPDSGAVFARNAFNPEYGSAIAFADTSLRPRSVTGDRAEFVGRNGNLARPAALKRVGLSGHVGAGLDPCAAILGHFDVAPHGSASVVFILGQASDAERASKLAAKYRDPADAEAAIGDVVREWDRRLATVRVKTPDSALDILVNRWLPYQVLACRVWGRSAFYQSGGAYGFRDQLQDVLALVYAEPGEARAHILRAASRQFLEGDVQHWWHPPTGRGVRTKFSDDFLWLPYAVARYVEVTGDATILNEPVRYVRGPVLGEHEQESYYQPDETAESDLVYVHCLRALDRGWALGAHGLPLMGCGDWNDGMNLVGAGGKGESVWVAWFQVLVRTRFAAVAEARGDAELATRMRSQADQLRQAIEERAWDGDWYLRAWFDDGTPLGSRANDECKIDSLPQSWSVLAGGKDEVRKVTAVDSAVTNLVDYGNKLVKLFTPPFDAGPLQPGYIKGYLPGIRENGGQYTHAAIWLVQALAGLGRGGEAHGLWSMLSPISHAETPEGVARYRVEPYVVAADVYGVPPHVGRGGWTWYTGSASWLYRAAVETLLGLTVRGQSLTFDPRIPEGWHDFEVEYRHGSSVYRCRVENPNGVERGVQEAWLDGQRVENNVITLADDGRTHEVRVVMG